MSKSLKVSGLVEGKFYRIKKNEKKFVYERDGHFLFEVNSRYIDSSPRNLNGKLLVFIEDRGKHLCFATTHNLKTAVMYRRDIRYLEEIKEETNEKETISNTL